MLSNFVSSWIFFSVIIGICCRPSESNHIPVVYELDRDQNVDPCWDYEPTK